MTNSPTRQPQSAFSIWLRMGLWPQQADDEIERKFNPWPDPENGQFTFAGGGRYFGGSFGGGGASGRWDARGSAADHGESGGGGGASGAWKASRPSKPLKQAPSQAIGKVSAAPGGAAAKVQTPVQRVVRDGYEFQIDDRQRTRQVRAA